MNKQESLNKIAHMPTWLKIFKPNLEERIYSYASVLLTYPPKELHTKSSEYEEEKKEEQAEVANLGKCYQHGVQ